MSRATQQKLRLAQDLLRHANPSGDPAEIFDRALTLLIEDLRRKKFAATTKPRASRGVAPGSPRVAAALKREVAQHDQERCSFVGTGGRRCGERAFVEFHHVEAVASGGVARKGWIELRCKAHNDYEAELFFSGTVNLPSVQHGPERVRLTTGQAAAALHVTEATARET